MDKDKIIALLNQDLEGEHGAIIQVSDSCLCYA